MPPCETPSRPSDAGPEAQPPMDWRDCAYEAEDEIRRAMRTEVDDYPECERRFRAAMDWIEKAITRRRSW